MFWPSTAALHPAAETLQGARVTGSELSWSARNLRHGGTFCGSVRSIASVTIVEDQGKATEMRP